MKAMTENEFSVDGWRYQCKRCNYQVGIDKAFPEACPGCGAGGWWGHLVTTGVNGKPTKNIFDGDAIKISNETMSGGIKIHNRILSQLPNAVEQCQAENNGVFEHPSARGRGRPLQPVPDDIILELSKEGFSSRKIAADLAGRGFHLSYKTIQRHLKAQRQLALI